MINRSASSSGGGMRLIFAAVIVIISLVSYCGMSQVNPVTGEKQHIAMSPEQEVALGMQAAPGMAEQFGGEDPDAHDQSVVKSIGASVVRGSDASKSPYEYDFHLLADRQTVNAFALPGGQVFITRALFDQLRSPGMVAGVLAHEVGHVVGRHSAEQMAQQQLTNGIAGAAAVATSDSRHPGGAAVAQMVAQMVGLKFSRADESEADHFGVDYMAQAGYDPNSMISVMEVLEKTGGGGGSEFFQTHPNPANRIGKIKEEIKHDFPNGLPAGLKK